MTVCSPVKIGSRPVAVVFYLEIPTAGPVGFNVDGVDYGVSLAGGDPGLVVTKTGETALELPLSPMFDALREHATSMGRLHAVPGDLLTTEIAGDRMSARLAIIEIRWSDEKPTAVIHYIEAFLFLGMP